jgi:hypothetical protein
MRGRDRARRLALIRIPRPRDARMEQTRTEQRRLEMRRHTYRKVTMHCSCPICIALRNHFQKTLKA